MKWIILICLVLPFCSGARVPQYNPVQQAAQAIKVAKSNVQDIQSDLQRAKSSLSMNTNSEMTNLYIDSSGTITNVRDTRLAYIQKQLDDAKAAGKDATDCLNAVSSKMRSAAQTGYSSLTQCQTQGKQQLQNELDKFDSAIATGQQYINQLDQIAVQCLGSGDAMQVGNCMILKVAAINAQIRVYQSSATTLKQSAQSNKSSIVLSVRNCNSGAVSIVNSASTDAIYAAAACLK